MRLSARAADWGEPQRRRLRATRSLAGHDAETAVRILREEFGVATASQPNLSRWETGATRRPKCASALAAYCDAYGDPDDGDDRSRAPLQEGATPAFDRLAEQIADQPLLAPLQAELLSGLSRRLANGPPMSPQDRATYLDQLRILRVPGHDATSGR